MSLATLPPELYLAILSHIPSSHLQISTLNLSRAIPFSPVPIRPLFEHISVSRQQQLPQLYRRLRYSPSKLADLGDASTDDECTWVKQFSVLIWQVDADILLNVLALLPVLEHLNLRIGPVFTPEHLQGMFKEPISSLNVLNLRFRPYVKTATYYQFLKGSYFDAVFDLIAGWPSSSSLTRLSIIQDPLPPPPAGRSAFAQPIVFFSLTPLTALSLSPATQNITHLRLRIPSRQPVRFIISSKPEDIHTGKYPFPNTTVLDLSTCALRNFSDLESLLNFVGGGHLRHLLLDHTGLCDGVARNWEMLGRTCALAGVKRSRDYEKTLKTLRHAITADTDNLEGTEERLANIAQDRRVRPGRRGMATATISLRGERPTVPAASTSLPHPGSSEKASKIRICPSPPRLLSLCISLPGQQHVAEEVRIREASARTDFIRGWSEGVGQLRSIWTRLRQSQSKGVKVCRFHVGGQNEGSEDIPMHTGLVEMRGYHNDKLWEELDTLQPPVLCFAGPRGEGFLDGHLEGDWSGHPNGCGHQISWDVWNDNI